MSGQHKNARFKPPRSVVGKLLRNARKPVFEAFATLVDIVKHFRSKSDEPQSDHYFSRRSPRAASSHDTKNGTTENGTTENGTAGESADVRAASPSAPERLRWIEARVQRPEPRVDQPGESRLRLATGAGTFARAGLDAGSALLLETVQIADARHILDLGCGWGALGCFCASLAPASRVWMCDINYAAVLLASRNARENDLTNIVAWRGDGARAARPDFFDLVLCNPPIRAGNATIARLFDDAWRVLKAGGALWIVIRTAQGAKSWQRRLQQQFGNCETIAIEGGYRILKCVK